MKKEINFELINEKISSGMKLRFDIGLSFNMPNTIKWLESDSNVFVISIEPHPDNFISCQNYLDNSSFKERCYLIESAIDNVDGPTQKVFYGLGGPATGYDPGTSSLKKPKGNFVDSVDKIYNVDVIPLFYILDNIQYDYIDFIKTDTQGNDLNVLKSLENHLNRVCEIYAEYDESDLYEDGNTGEELDQFLFENNFEKYESIVAPSRNNKVEDCKYKNINNFYPYINGKTIIVSKQSWEQNNYTWANGQVIDDLPLIGQWLSYIEPNFTILDIGAQSGSFSLAAKFYPDTTWYSFEPDLENYELLIQNLNLNSVTNVITSHEALSNKVGESALNIYTEHKGLNTLGEKFVKFLDTDVIQKQVKTNTLDNLFFDKQIDLIKIDTEGSEYNILMGGIETIKRSKPKILLEYQEDKLNQFGYTCNDILKLIDELDYRIRWTDSSGSNIFIEPK